MTRRKTDGERIAARQCSYPEFQASLAARIDRIIRRRQKEAWNEGFVAHRHSDFDNPYVGRREK